MTVSVAALRPSAVVYREEQYFDWRVYALVAVLEVVAVCAPSWSGGMGPNLGAPAELWGVAFSRVVALGVVALTAFIIDVLKMTTEATPLTVRVWFGWVPIYRRLVPVASIKRVEVVTFRPLADHGGWGIRANRAGDRVLTARGNRGVRLELADGSRLLIGSQRPEELARTLERTLHPDV